MALIIKQAGHRWSTHRHHSHDHVTFFLLNTSNFPTKLSKFMFKMPPPRKKLSVARENPAMTKEQWYKTVESITTFITASADLMQNLKDVMENTVPLKFSPLTESDEEYSDVPPNDVDVPEQTSLCPCPHPQKDEFRIDEIQDPVEELQQSIDDTQLQEPTKEIRESVETAEESEKEFDGCTENPEIGATTEQSPLEDTTDTDDTDVDFKTVPGSLEEIKIKSDDEEEIDDGMRTAHGSSGELKQNPSDDAIDKSTDITSDMTEKLIGISDADDLRSIEPEFNKERAAGQLENVKENPETSGKAPGIIQLLLVFEPSQPTLQPTENSRKELSSPKTTTGSHTNQTESELVLKASTDRNEDGAVESEVIREDEPALESSQRKSSGTGRVSTPDQNQDDEGKPNPEVPQDNEPPSTDPSELGGAACSSMSKKTVRCIDEISSDEQLVHLGKLKANLRTAQNNLRNIEDQVRELEKLLKDYSTVNTPEGKINPAALYKEIMKPQTVPYFRMNKHYQMRLPSRSSLKIDDNNPDTQSSNPLSSRTSIAARRPSSPSCPLARRYNNHKTQEKVSVLSVTPLSSEKSR